MRVFDQVGLLPFYLFLDKVGGGVIIHNDSQLCVCQSKSTRTFVQNTHSSPNSVQLFNRHLLSLCLDCLILNVYKHSN